MGFARQRRVHTYSAPGCRNTIRDKSSPDRSDPDPALSQVTAAWPYFLKVYGLNGPRGARPRLVVPPTGYIATAGRLWDQLDLSKGRPGSALVLGILLEPCSSRSTS